MQYDVVSLYAIFLFNKVYLPETRDFHTSFADF